MLVRYRLAFSNVTCEVWGGGWLWSGLSSYRIVLCVVVLLISKGRLSVSALWFITARQENHCDDQRYVVGDKACQGESRFRKQILLIPITCMGRTERKRERKKRWGGGGGREVESGDRVGGERTAKGREIASVCACVHMCVCARVHERETERGCVRASERERGTEIAIQHNLN